MFSLLTVERTDLKWSRVLRAFYTDNVRLENVSEGWRGLNFHRFLWNETESIVIRISPAQRPNGELDAKLTVKNFPFYLGKLYAQSADENSLEMLTLIWITFIVLKISTLIWI